MLSFQACSKINLSRKDTPAANYLLSKEPEKTDWKGGAWHIKQFPRQENLPQRRRYELRARGETEMKQEIRNGRSLSGKPKEMNESRKEPPNCSFQRTRIPATQLKRRPRRAAELGVRRQDIDREETIRQAMPKRPALESLPRTINLLAFIRLTLLQCSAFSYALSLGYLPKSLFKPVCLISLGQSRPAWEGSFRPGKQLSSSQEETAKRREEEDWKMKTSEGEEINQQGEPPNKSINRTRKPTPHYPFTHSGPVISVLDS